MQRHNGVFFFQNYESYLIICLIVHGFRKFDMPISVSFFFSGIANFRLTKLVHLPVKVYKPIEHVPKYSPPINFVSKKLE